MISRPWCDLWRSPQNPEMPYACLLRWPVACVLLPPVPPARPRCAGRFLHAIALSGMIPCFPSSPFVAAHQRMQGLVYPRRSLFLWRKRAVGTHCTRVCSRDAHCNAVLRAAHAPRSGYALLRTLKRPIDFFWQAGQSQIYPELKRLEVPGLVNVEVVVQLTRPATRVYSITPEGWKTLHTRAVTPVEAAPARNELLLNTSTIWLADPTQALALFRP